MVQRGSRISNEEVEFVPPDWIVGKALPLMITEDSGGSTRVIFGPVQANLRAGCTGSGYNYSFRPPNSFVVSGINMDKS